MFWQDSMRCLRKDELSAVRHEVCQSKLMIGDRQQGEFSISSCNSNQVVVLLHISLLSYLSLQVFYCFLLSPHTQNNYVRITSLRIVNEMPIS